jgi:hypothetical protein
MVLVVGQALLGAIALFQGLKLIRFFLAMGGLGALGNCQTEAASFGCAIWSLTAVGSVLYPIESVLRLVISGGLHFRKRWARLLAIGMGLFGVGTMVCDPSSLLESYNWLVFAFSIFTLIVLFRRKFANQFASRSKTNKASSRP